MTTTFRHTNVNFLPNVTATQIDPNNVQASPQNEVLSNYNFLSQLRAINFSMDRDIVGQVNARLPLRASNASTSFLKIGAKFRDKSKGRNRNENTVTSPTTLKMTSYLETGFDLPPYLDGRYDLTPYESQSLVENIPNQITPIITRNHARDAEEFDGTERVTAGYAMAEIYAGPKLFILPGIRYEYTSEDFVGRNVRFAPNGTWLGTDPIGTTAGYGVALPGSTSEVCGDAGHQPPVRGHADAGAAELLRHGALPGPGRQRQYRRDWQRQPQADDLLERRCAGGALPQVGRGCLGGRLLQAPDRLHLHLHAAAGDQRRAVSSDAAAER